MSFPRGRNFRVVSGVALRQLQISILQGCLVDHFVVVQSFTFRDLAELFVLLRILIDNPLAVLFHILY